jgi:hypothetical protein
VRSTALLGERRMLYVCRPLPAGGGGPGFGRAALADLAGAEPEYFVCGRIFGGARKVVNAFNGIYYGCLSRSLGAGHMGTEEHVLTVLAHTHRYLCHLHLLGPGAPLGDFFDDVRRSAGQRGRA